jgi:very-short-patch-repair endonuclease
MPQRIIIPYNSDLKLRARELRNNSTLSEVLLWNQLKRKQMRGYQFFRQKPLDNFIVDFFCYELMLVIEIDGESHLGRKEYDYKRQKVLEGYGIHVLRFSDLDVKNNLFWVLSCIEEWIDRFEGRYEDG